MIIFIAICSSVPSDWILLMVNITTAHQLSINIPSLWLSLRLIICNQLRQFRLIPIWQNHLDNIIGHQTQIKW